MALPPVALRTKRFPPAIGVIHHRLVAHMAECDLIASALCAYFEGARRRVALHLLLGGVEAESQQTLVELRVIERSRYTTLIQLVQRPRPAGGRSPNMRIRISRRKKR